MQAIIEKAIQGDVEAFLELMDRNALAMYKVARAILNNNLAEAGVFQDVVSPDFD